MRANTDDAGASGERNVLGQTDMRRARPGGKETPGVINGGEARDATGVGRDRPLPLPPITLHRPRQHA